MEMGWDVTGYRTSADVQTEVHLADVVRDAVVVALDVRVQQFIWCLRVQLILCPPLEHLLRAEI